MNIIDALNRLAQEQNIEDVQQQFKAETRDQYGNLIRRAIDGSDRSKDIVNSIKGRTAGVSEVKVDASTSVLNNFLTVGEGNQTVDRLMPTPRFFGGGEQKTKSLTPITPKNKQPSIGGTNTSNDQGGKS